MPKQNKIGKQSSSVSTAFNMSSDEQTLNDKLSFIVMEMETTFYTTRYDNHILIKTQDRHVHASPLIREFDLECLHIWSDCITFKVKNN